MARTFRMTTTPLVFYSSVPDHASVTLASRDRVSWRRIPTLFLDDPNLQHEMFRLWADKGKVRYKPYRKKADATFRSYVKQELQRYVSQPDYEVQVPPYRKVGWTYWD